MSTPLTPPTRTSGLLSPPQMMEPPSAGCSVEELRLFVMQIVQQQGVDMTDMQVQIVTAVNPIKQALDGCLRDVNVFAAIKHYVTEELLEARTASIHEDIKALTHQCNQFSTSLGGYLQRTDVMEKEFQGHVETAFAKVEREFAGIKSVVGSVHTEHADAGNASTAQVQLAQNSLHQRTCTMET